MAHDDFDLIEHDGRPTWRHRPSGRLLPAVAGGDGPVETDGDGPASGPCGQWITPQDVTVCCPGLGQDVDPERVIRGITYATEILWALSGRRFTGSCERIVRPCFADNGGCGNGFYAQWPLSGWSFWVWDQAAQGYSFPAMPYRLDGQWYNFGSCGGLCSLNATTLPMPVQKVLEVVVDGYVVDDTLYQVSRFGQLERVDGRHWPCTQDRRRISSSFAEVPGDDDRRGTWQVRYVYGRRLSPGGVIATARFACEMTKALCGDESCNLPARLKEIVGYEGESLSFADPMQFLDRGEVGIYEVDLWLNAVNPNKLQRRATIRSLALPPQYRGVTYGRGPHGD